jgi:hypothetical protein
MEFTQTQYDAIMLAERMFEFSVSGSAPQPGAKRRLLAAVQTRNKGRVR